MFLKLFLLSVFFVVLGILGAGISFWLLFTYNNNKRESFDDFCIPVMMFFCVMYSIGCITGIVCVVLKAFGHLV